MKQLRRDILQTRANSGGINAGSENHSKKQKEIKTLENRLDKANQKFNEAIAHNKKLREEIDSLRRERVIFDNIYQKLEKELNEKRKSMANIIEEANRAYDERDTIRRNMQELKTKQGQKLEEFVKQVKNLDERKEKTNKMVDILQNFENKSLLDDPRNKSTIKKDNKQMALEKENEDKTHDDKVKLKDLEEGFAKIQANTNITDIDSLVNTFIDAEEKNFMLYKFVNEVNSEIEEKENSNKKIIEELSHYSSNTVDYKKSEELQDLEKKTQNQRQKSKNYSDKQFNAHQTIKDIMKSIYALFNELDCDKVI